MPTIDRNDEHATRYEATLEEQIDYVARQYTGHQAKDRFIEAILASLERLRAIEQAAQGLPEEPYKRDDGMWQGIGFASLDPQTAWHSYYKALRAHAAALQADARRYRWLNQQDHFMIYISHSFDNKDLKENRTYRLKCGECLDSWVDARIAAIDQAMTGERGGEG